MYVLLIQLLLLIQLNSLGSKVFFLKLDELVVEYLNIFPQTISILLLLLKFILILINPGLKRVNRRLVRSNRVLQDFLIADQLIDLSLEQQYLSLERLDARLLISILRTQLRYVIIILSLRFEFLVENHDGRVQSVVFDFKIPDLRWISGLQYRSPGEDALEADLVILVLEPRSRWLDVAAATTLIHLR